MSRRAVIHVRLQQLNLLVLFAGLLKLPFLMVKIVKTFIMQEKQSKYRNGNQKLRKITVVEQYIDGVDDG